jgi:hypothetical protein
VTIYALLLWSVHTRAGEIFTVMGIFRDGISDAAPTMSGWARTKPGNDVAESMRVPLINGLNAWFMPSCFLEFE